MTTCELTPTQLKLVTLSAELAGLSDCLRLECEEEDVEPSDFRSLLAQTLKRVGKELWHLVDEVH